MGNDINRVVSRVPCPSCRERGEDTKGDNKAVYADGHGYCFSCSTYYPSKEQDNYQPQQEVNTMHTGLVEPRGTISEIRDRKISKSICEKYGVKLAFNQEAEVIAHYYPYYDKDTHELIGYKERHVKTKGFNIIGTNRNAGLFGQDSFKSGQKYITITEGEIDALSISEMFDGKYAVVSVKNGASAAYRDIKENLEFVESFDNIVICFDQDEAGKKAVKEIQDLFTPGKLKICKLPLKDANEMLLANRIKDFTECWWNAKEYTPVGIVRGSDTWDYVNKNKDVRTVLYPWKGLNEVTYGFRQKELVTITSGSGMGKTSVVKELEAHILNVTDDNLAIIHLEEDIDRSVKGLMSIECNLPIHIPKYEELLSEEEEKLLWQKAVGDKNVFFYDHFGSMSEDSLLSVIRTFAKSYDCKWIVLDHLSIVISEQDGILDERKAIDAIMTKLRKIVQETGVGLFLISHLRRPQGKAHEEGGQVSLSELRGSAAIAQLSDMVFGLERNQQADEEEERNTTTIRVIKNRFCGLTGKACQLMYNKDTGRLKEIKQDGTENSLF